MNTSLHPTLDRYTLSRNSDEQERLNKQHEYITETVFDGRLIYKNIKLERGMKVLDSATGTGCWILDLSKEVDKSVTLIGADISSAMFPISYPSNVQFAETSVTNMPKEWTGAFDFISQRFLTAALTKSQWINSLKELYRVLKPGGMIQFVELHSFNPFGEGLRKTKEAWKVFLDLLDKQGHLKDCGERVLDFAQNAGFENIEENVLRAPIGRKWGKAGEAGAENMYRALQGLEAAIAVGRVGNYGSQSEFHSVLQSARKEWEDCEGLFLSITVVTAKKPMY